MQPMCGVTVCFREAGARCSGRARLHNFGQLMWRLSYMDVVHEGAELVGYSVTNW